MIKAYEQPYRRFKLYVKPDLTAFFLHGDHPEHKYAEVLFVNLCSSNGPNITKEAWSWIEAAALLHSSSTVPPALARTRTNGAGSCAGNVEDLYSAPGLRCYHVAHQAKL
jgi:hypothetical protein